MNLTRRELLKLGSVGAATLAGCWLWPAHASDARPAGRSGRSLRILILGGTGFTGPFRVRDALERGHPVTLFNRGRRTLDWPAEVEELTGDRDNGDVAVLADRERDVCIDNPTSVPSWVRDIDQVLRGNVRHYVFISGDPAGADRGTGRRLRSFHSARDDGRRHTRVVSGSAGRAPVPAAGGNHARARGGSACSVARAILKQRCGDALNSRS